MPKRRFTDDTNGGKKARGGAGGSERYTFAEMRFVRIELTEGEKAEFRSLLATDEFNSNFIDQCIGARYSVTVNADKNGGGVLVSIRAEYKDMLDGGLILTGRGKDFATAAAVCEFKATYLADENGWAEAETRRGGSSSDIA